MKFRHFGAALGVVAVLMLPAQSAMADDYHANSPDGLLSFAAKLVSGVLHPKHIFEGMFGSTPTPVNMTNSGAIDVTVVATPTGASTSANQTTLITAFGAQGDGAWSGSGSGSLIAIDKSIYAKIEATRVLIAGSQATVNSVPGTVTYLADGLTGALQGFADVRPASSTITAADAATTSAAGQSGVLLVSGSPTANSFQTQAISGQSSATITTTGTFVATDQIEASYNNGTTYVAVSGLLRGTSLTTASITGPGVISLDVTGATQLRVRAISYTSGTETVQMAFSNAPGMTKVLNGVKIVDAAGAAGLDADEKHHGEFGGNQNIVQVTPTVTAVAFTSGWAVGGLQTIAGASRVTGGTGLLQDVAVAFKSNQTSAQAAMDIFLFSDTSLSSICTNAAAFVLSSTDFPKLLGVIHVTDTTAGNTTTLAQALNLAKGYKTAATTLYACAVTRGTPTWGTTSDLTFSYDFVRN